MNRLMKHIFTLCAAIIIGLTQASAHYSVSSVSGNVHIKQGAKTVTATAGMTIKPADLIIIGEDSSIDILDSIDSQIYSAGTPGQVTVTRIMFDAKKKARSNSNVVHDKIRMGKTAESGDGVIFVQKGKVTRALSTYDPDAERVQVDVDMLSRRLYSMLLDSLNDISALNSPVIIHNRHNESNGILFSVENILSFPIYFNVMKLNDDGMVSISELGQPVGSYALQPDQSIARCQNSGLSGNECHILIMTNYYFEIDELLTKLNALVAEKAAPGNPEGDFPLYIRVL